jgi:hypothetical protein
MWKDPIVAEYEVKLTIPDYNSLFRGTQDRPTERTGIIRGLAKSDGQFSQLKASLEPNSFGVNRI